MFQEREDARLLGKSHNFLLTKSSLSQISHIGLVTLKRYIHLLAFTNALVDWTESLNIKSEYCIVTKIDIQFFGFSHCLQLFITSWKSSTCKVISKKLYFARSFAVASRKISWASAVDSIQKWNLCWIAYVVTLVANCETTYVTYS